MSIELDVRSPDHVTGHSVIRADLDLQGKQVVVLSGIACPAWGVDTDETQRQQCRVLLHEPGGVVDSSSVHVGLASIANDDSSYVFATDTVGLETDAAGDLVLTTDLAVMGETSALQRFSYQVVLTTRVVTASITGTISWPREWFEPHGPGPAGVSGLFRIMANTVTSTPSPFGPIEGLVPRTPGEVVSVSDDGETCVATYRIAEPPRGEELRVTVDQLAMTGPGSGEVFISWVGPGSDHVTLTTHDPNATDVDFAAAYDSGPA